MLNENRNIIQPTLVIILGIVIGLSLALTLLFPVKFALVGVTAIFLPILVLVVGQWKHFFLALLLVGIPLMARKTIYAHSISHIGGPGGIDLTIIDLALAALYLHWILTIITQRPYRNDFIRLEKFDLLVFGFILVSALSLSNAADLSLGFIGLTRFVKVGLLYFYLANNLRTAREFKFVILALMIGVLLHSLISVGQYFLGRPLGLHFLGESLEFGSIDLGSGSLGRPGGLMQSANTSAFFLACTLPFTLAPLFWLPSKGIKTFCLLTFATGFFTLVVTYSRGGWLGFFFAICCFIFLAIRKNLFSIKKNLLNLVLLGLICMMAGLVLSPKVLQRLTDTPATPLYTRAFLNRLAVEQITAHPVIGMGYNNFSENSAGMIRHISDSHNILHLVAENPMVHNIFLLVTAETGILGLMVFLAVIYILFRKSLGLIKLQSPFFAGLGIAIFAFLVGFMVTEMFDFSFMLDQGFYLFWILSGFTIALCRYASVER